jgi:hypothetical protein
LRIDLRNPESIHATNTDAVAAQVAFPGCIGQFGPDVHDILRAFRYASLAKVAFGKIHKVCPSLIQSNRLGRAHPCTVSTLGADFHLEDAWSWEKGVNLERCFLRIAFQEEVE